MARVYLFSILQDLGLGSDYFLDALCVGRIFVRYSRFRFRLLIGNKHHWSSWNAVVQVVAQRCSITHKSMRVADEQVCRIGVSRASRHVAVPEHVVMELRRMLGLFFAIHLTLKTNENTKLQLWQPC